MSEVIYAIGDIHGRDDLLAKLHESICAHHEYAHSGKSAALLYIGDYIDRGASSRAVIDRTMRGIEGFESITLLGNHEALMLDCLETEDPEVWSVWLQNGGLSTLNSFGVSFGKGSGDPALLQQALGPERIAWLRALKLYHETAGLLFVHAGIVPGVPLSDQTRHDLLWVREPFLDSTEDHGRLVIHGHTPSEEVEICGNRIGIDTGAVHFGRLTAVALTEGEVPRFLYATGEPGKGPATT